MPSKTKFSHNTTIYTMSEEVEVKSVRYNKPTKVNSGFVKTDTKGYSDNKIVVAFTELIELLPDQRNNNNRIDAGDVYAKFVHDIGDSFYVFKSDLADAVGKVVKQINLSIQEAYDAGKEEGKRAIVMLNTGEITLDQFENK